MKNRSKVRFVVCLIAVVFCLTACDDISIDFDLTDDSLSKSEGSYSDEEKKNTEIKEEEYDFYLTEDIQIKYLGLNVYAKDYDGWNNYISDLIGGYGNLDYFLENSYVINAQKWGGYYPTAHVIKEFDPIEMMTGEQIATIEFDKEGLIKEINVIGKGNDDFNISGLQVGENAKEYLNLLTEGLWDKLMAMENNRVLRGPDGLYMYHNVQSNETGDIDNISLDNDRITITYRVRDEIVQNINIYTKNDSIKDELVKDLYDMDMSYYYIDGINLTGSNAQEWLDHFGFQYSADYDGYIPYVDNDLYVRYDSYDNANYSITVANPANVEWREVKTMSGKTIKYPELICDDTNTYCTVNGQMNVSNYDVSVEIYPLIRELRSFNADGVTFGDSFADFLNGYDPTAYDRLLSEGYIKSGYWSFGIDEYDGITYATMNIEYFGYSHLMYSYSFILDGTNVGGIHVNYILNN